jgi:hypothetical protein
MSDRINHLIPIIEIPVPYQYRDFESVRAYGMHDIRAVLSLDDGLWHLSIHHRHRDPTWDEMVTLRYRICPEVETMVMYLPPLKDYVNINKHSFHWYELKADSEQR